MTRYRQEMFDQLYIEVVSRVAAAMATMDPMKSAPVAKVAAAADEYANHIIQLNLEPEECDGTLRFAPNLPDIYEGE